MQIITVLNPEEVKRMGHFVDLIMQAPFPNGTIITQLVSITFPEFTQREVYAFTQRIKHDIEMMELTCKLASRVKDITDAIPNN